MASKANTAPSERSVGTREVILDAAEKLFAERGFAGTSVRDIVRASESSPPSLYHFFGSKENLLVELVTDRYDRYCAELEARLSQAATPFEVCKSVVDLALDNMKREPNTIEKRNFAVFGPQQDLPREPLRALLVRWELIVHERLKSVAPDVGEDRIVFARMMLNGLVTPPVLLFLTSGMTTFDADLSSCLAQRVSDVLTDDQPVCAWPNFAAHETKS